MATAVRKLADRDQMTAVVEALFAGSADVIPERYVQPVHVWAEAVVGDGESYQLPVVDMAKLLDQESSAEETRKLGSACFDWGFFQLANHGIDEALIQRIKDDTVAFFKLPREKKNAVAIGETGIEGFGLHYKNSSNDKLDWAESLIVHLKPVRSLERWPMEPTTFRDALDKYSEGIANTARTLLLFLASNLGVGQERLLSLTEMQSIAFHHYPPCRQPEKVIGMTPHTDCFGLTLLLPVDDTPGLQISKDGRWFPVRPLPGALIVNVGDSLEILTNGRYRSVEHRVVVNAGKSRMSAAVVVGIPHGRVIAPIPELVSQDKPLYKSVGGQDHVKGFVDALNGPSKYIETMKES